MFSLFADQINGKHILITLQNVYKEINRNTDNNKSIKGGSCVIFTKN